MLAGLLLRKLDVVFRNKQAMETDKDLQQQKLSREK